MATRTSTKKTASKSKSKNKQDIRPIDFVVVGLAAVLIMFGLWNMRSKQAGLPCDKPGQEHNLIVRNDAFNVTKLTIAQCDVIKIANLDATQSYEFAFGVHDKHIQYPGFNETVIRPNEFIAIDAIKAGIYRIHDHLRDKAAVEFTIEAK
jgi:hypothetical protein